MRIVLVVLALAAGISAAAGDAARWIDQRMADGVGYQRPGQPYFAAGRILQSESAERAETRKLR